MPLHLSSSRRQFLRFSLAGGGTLLSQPWLSADEESSSSWALMADSHIDADPATEARGAVMAKNLERVVQEIIAEQESLSGAFLNGDCAYLKGLPGDYSILSQLTTPLSEAGVPIHFSMGNHDDRAPFYDAFAAQRPGNPPVQGKHVTVLETPHLNWFMVDSLQIVDNVTGEVGAEQRQWLASALDERSEKPAVIIGHHNLQETPGERNGKPHYTGLEDSIAFRDLMVSRPQVKAYAFGHTHNWNVKHPGHMDGLYLINLPPVAYVFNESRPNGWVRATPRENGIDLELRALDPAHPEHAQTTSLEWR